MTTRSGSDLSRSFVYCERLARREAANFYPAFRVLALDQRRAMCALYAFMRVTDDVTDGPDDDASKRLALAAWRDRTASALAGDDSHPLHPAFRHTVLRHGIPRDYLDDVLDGVAMDLDVTAYDTFDDLYRYCYRVASAVGLCCIHVWGFKDERAKKHAEAAGIAFQLTNILRDVAEDAARGRVYLPCEDLERFGCRPQQLIAGPCDDRFRDLMRFEAERARAYYDAGEGLLSLLPPAGRAVFLVMTRTYRALLDAIARRDYDVFSERIRLTRLHKLWLAARALPVRFGLV